MHFVGGGGNNLLLCYRVDFTLSRSAILTPAPRNPRPSRLVTSAAIRNTSVSVVEQKFPREAGWKPRDDGPNRGMDASLARCSACEITLASSVSASTARKRELFMIPDRCAESPDSAKRARTKTTRGDPTNSHVVGVPEKRGVISNLQLVQCETNNANKLRFRRGGGYENNLNFSFHGIPPAHTTQLTTLNHISFIETLKLRSSAPRQQEHGQHTLSSLRLFREMLVDTPQICWHGGEAGKAAPILSIDTHPLALGPRRGGDHHAGEAGARRFILATAGTDAEVRIWVVNQPTWEDASSWEQPGLSGRMQSFVASLGGHQRGVNVVRFSPDGLSLASASDGGTVVVWSVETLAAWSTLSSDRDTKKTIMRGATEDIYDMSWSPDSRYLACGSIDRRAHIWEVTTKRSIATLEDHANYVQVRLCLLLVWADGSWEWVEGGETHDRETAALLQRVLASIQPERDWVSNP